MSVFLSKNNTEPYQIIDTLHFPMSDLIVYGTESTEDIIIHQDYFYVIFEKGSVYNNVKVKVSLDYELGVAIDIAKTDLVGNPLEWKHSINLGNVDASSSTQKYLIAYRWRIINNLYIVKPGDKVALITVTADA